MEEFKSRRPAPQSKAVSQPPPNQQTKPQTPPRTRDQQNEGVNHQQKSTVKSTGAKSEANSVVQNGELRREPTPGAADKGDDPQIASRRQTLNTGNKSMDDQPVSKETMRQGSGRDVPMDGDADLFDKEQKLASAAE